MIFFFLLLLGTITHTKLSLVSVWGLSLWGFLHMAGGGIPVGDGVLYGHIIYPIIDRGGEFVIFKFDQLVHFFGFGVATLVMYEIIKPRWRGSLGLLAFVVALAGMGLGALNEVVEFMAVVFMPETGVGGYYNTGLDLVFNAIGATVVALVLYKWKK
jgi:putative membrane protein